MRCISSRLGGIGLAVGLASISAASPATATVLVSGNFRIEFVGAYQSQYSGLDTAVESWMSSNNIPCAQLAVRQNGTLIFSHAYTYGASTALVKTTSIFRLASISKMVTTAAISQLMTAGTLTGQEDVYPYLGITKPLLKGQKPDPNANVITTTELVNHTSGLPGSGVGDPLFEMRDIEVQLGKEPLSANQFARYLYGLTLNSVPGTTENYSNVGYFLLGQMVEKASGQGLLAYANSQILRPLGMTNWSLAPTLASKAKPSLVFADDGYVGPSVFDISPSAPATQPFNFDGGDIIWEVAAAPSDFATNAESVSLFIHTWDVYGLGGRQYDYARDGCVPGVATWAESLNADIDFSLLLNSQPCLGFSSTVIQQLESQLAGM